MPRIASVYCEAVMQPQDIYYEGSEDEDYGSAEVRRQRYEAAAQRFLEGNVPLLISATLQGPFEEESGWVNPWRSKNRTAKSQTLRESDDIPHVHSTPKRPATSAEQHATEVLKGAECALPSPESLKQAPFTSISSRLQETDHKAHDWRANGASPSRNSDEFWTAKTPSKTRKRKSKSSPGLDSAANKRRRTRSTEIEIETPTPRKNLSAKKDASQRGARTSRANSDASSIYLHIRELTSQLPPPGSQDLSSEDAETDTDDEHYLIISTRSSVDLSLANRRRTTPRKDSPRKILRQNKISSTSLFSPSSQRSLRGVSPLSFSPTQTPTRRKAMSSVFSGRRQASGDLSTPSEALTNLPGWEDSEMLNVNDSSEDVDDATLIERQLQEEQLTSPEGNNGNCASTSPDMISATLPTPGSSYEERPSGEERIIETPKARKVGHRDSPVSNDTPRRRLKLFGAMRSSRMAAPLIYDDAEGSDLPISNSGNAASSTPRRSKSQPIGRTPIKTNIPHKSSPLRSLSPRNARINSRPALKKIVQPFMSTLRKSLAANADEIRYSQEGNSQQSNENEQEETAEASLPTVLNTPASSASQNEIVTDEGHESDHSTINNAQELVVQETSISTTSHPNTLSVEVTQEDVSPSVLQQDEPSLTAPGLSTDVQLPVEQAISNVAEPQINRDTLEKPSEPSSIAPGDQQEHREETRPAEAVAESPLLPSQPPLNALPERSETPQRPATPEPQFAIASFSTFMSPSPNPRRRRLYFSGSGLGGTASKPEGTLLSCMKKSWGSTMAKKRVTWAPLPHEGRDSAGQHVPSETDTSSSMTRGRGRVVSPPPPPSMDSSSDSLMKKDVKFGLHFAAVADRSKGISPHSMRAVLASRTPSPDRHGPAKKVDVPQVEKNGFATKTWGHDDEDPTDIVQDIFNDMDDFLQVWDVDAELNEARKADRTRAGAKEAERASEDVDMFASFL
ncbi:hypothetical protein ACQKWADRAFT_280149 [Trichoderma austrokoningii]